MAKKDNVSMSVVKRIPRYYRFLSELKAQGIMRVSSKELSEKMNLTASQIRQDFNCFGEFGQQGYGYSVDQLYNEIRNILGLKHAYKAILIGVGNLGKAVAVHMNFDTKGFCLVGVFDQNKDLTGKKIKDLEIQNTNKLTDFCKKNKPDVAILCIPKNSVEKIVNELYSLGIKNYWNFSHFDIAALHNDVIVENVHMSDSLMTLCYRITENENKEN